MNFIPNYNRLAKDSRWAMVHQVRDLIAVLKDIETRLHFIDTHAKYPDLFHVAVNLERIQEEATGAGYDMTKIRKYLFSFQDKLIDEIYHDSEGIDEMGSTNNQRGRRVYHKVGPGPRRLKKIFRGHKQARKKEKK